ncbi:cytochrome P450 [Mycena latifolia]|nr:cytochrome P450 [Mycena latifolia]
MGYWRKLGMKKLKIFHQFPPGKSLARKLNIIVLGHFSSGYIPDFVFLLALRLRIGPLSALLSFRKTTAQLMKEKGQDLQRDVNDKSDVLSTIFAGRGSKRNGITPDQLLNQIPIILIGGQDTTSTAWAFHWLAQNSEFQDSLRQEILSANLNLHEGELDYDNMPLLNALLKETLRLEALWGPDASEFKPSRWLDGDPCKGQTNPLGPYRQLFAFLGWSSSLRRTAICVILTQLLANFAFSLPKDSVVRARFSGTQFPADSEGVKGL